MQAVQVSKYGGREQLKLADAPMPEPKIGEALVRINYAGVNFIDVYLREGHYRRSETYGSQLPITIGMEGGGVVEAVGPDIDSVKPGDRVAYMPL